MFKDPVVNKLNKFLGNHIFNVPIFDSMNDPNYTVDVKLKITGEKQYITVGTLKDYYTYTIFILSNQKDSVIDLVKLMIQNQTEFEITTRSQNTFLFTISYKTRDLLLNFFDYFGLERLAIATKIVVEPNDENINESLMSESNKYDGISRKIVRDIITIFKRKKEGSFNLPEDLGEDSEIMTYEFKSINPFSVNLELIKDDNIEEFEIDGDYYRDDDTIEIKITSNSNFRDKYMYELIGELNEVIRHELEHMKQKSSGYKFPSYEPKTSYGYYSRPHEIEAQIAGFKRKSKIQKKDLRDVARNWYEKNRNKHNLSQKQIDMIMDKIIPSF